MYAAKAEGKNGYYISYQVMVSRFMSSIIIKISIGIKEMEAKVIFYSLICIYQKIYQNMIVKNLYCYEKNRDKRRKIFRILIKNLLNF